VSLVLAGCSGDEEPTEPGAPSGSAAGPSAGPSTQPDRATAAEELTEQLLRGAEAPEPLATVRGSFPEVSGVPSGVVTVDVLEVRAAQGSTLLRWRLRSPDAQRVRVYTSALSLPNRFDTRAVALVDAVGEQQLQAFTYVPEGGDLASVVRLLRAARRRRGGRRADVRALPAAGPADDGGRRPGPRAGSGARRPGHAMSRSLLLAVAVVLLAGCTGGGSEPAAAPSSAARETPPADFVEQAVGELSFSVPQDWVEVELPEGSGAVVGRRELALRAPDLDGGPGAGAYAVIDPAPRRSAEAEVEDLLAVKRDVERVPDVGCRRWTCPGSSTQ
jgi:hypothetical protein